MKVWNKIKSFFSASSPFFTYLLIQLSGIIFCAIAILINKLSVNAFDMESFVGVKEVEITLLCDLLCNFICVAAIFFQMRFYSYKFSDISPTKQNGKVCIWTVFFSIGAFFVISFINSRFIGLTGLAPEESALGFSSLATLLWLLVNIFYAFIEELIFRGLLYKNYEKDFSVVFSAAVIILESILINIPAFGIMLYVLIYSLILFYIRRRFGDIRLCIIMHIIMNLFENLSFFIGEGYYNTVMNIGAAAGLVIAAASMYLMIKCADAPEKAPKAA